MTHQPFLPLLLLPAAFLFGKAPTDTSSVCDRFRQNDVIFTGTAENSWITLLDTREAPFHKRSEKSKRVRFLVREWFKGARQDAVEVWMTPGDCAMKIDAGVTYLMYARLNKDKQRLESNACQGTKPAEEAASDLSYLTAAQSGPGRATRVSGAAGTQGLNVQATSGVDIRYAVTDNAGHYTFDGLPAGDWSFSVNGGPSKQAHLEPGACVDLPLGGSVAP
jgi:hypothetical protein